jgi:ComF family protein
VTRTDIWIAILDSNLELMANISRWLLNLFLKSNCPLCQRPTGELICTYCQKQIQACQFQNPAEFWRGDFPLFAWGTYQGTVKRSIAAFKYENQPELARPLGTWLGKAWQQSPPIRGKLAIVPIPMHPEKQKQRGFNQAELLAESFCRLTGHKLRSTILSRVKATAAQFSLSAQAREQNLQGAFQVTTSGQKFPEPVLLLDDIYTTGATARSAKAVLEAAGIPVVGIIALTTTKKF